MNTTTVGVATDNNMFNFKHIDGILHNRKAIKICVNYLVSNITMYKKLTRFKIRQFLSGHTAIRATNPKVMWRLMIRKLFEVSRIFFLHSLRPTVIVGKELFNFIHFAFLKILKKLTALWCKCGQY